jgi:hypothetical protein
MYITINLCSWKAGFELFSELFVIFLQAQRRWANVQRTEVGCVCCPMQTKIQWVMVPLSILRIYSTVSDEVFHFMGCYVVDRYSVAANWSYLQDSSSTRTGSIGCTATSVNNYHRTLCSNTEGRKSRLHHDGNLESRIVTGPSFTVIEKRAVCTLDGPLFWNFAVDSPFNTQCKAVRVTFHCLKADSHIPCRFPAMPFR